VSKVPGLGIDIDLVSPARALASHQSRTPIWKRSKRRFLERPYSRLMRIPGRSCPLSSSIMLLATAFEIKKAPVRLTSRTILHLLQKVPQGRRHGATNSSAMNEHIYPAESLRAFATAASTSCSLLISATTASPFLPSLDFGHHRINPSQPLSRKRLRGVAY